VMPGVLILEALAQASCLLAIKTVYSQDGDDNTLLHLLAGIDNARFKRVVEPGDQLRLEVEVLRHRQGVWKFKGVASVDGHLVCSTDMTSAGKVS
jgi:3-hydroxyacyl-[acyl-carrier-protein] dehydratase